MIKGFMNQQNQPVVVEENMSNLTSASGEAASVSSCNRNDNNNNNTITGGIYPPQYNFAPPNQQVQAQHQIKKKRNQPGNPDPGAEVIALSPKTLMATNRFVCEICNKGFQRDQNLQLHRRGHNLPWKLKQRTSKEIRKKVYVCPEPSCLHHDPSRALGDLTGIKKHFCRKHGEKKWKCEKCSKKYAVQSDWKAHSKTCGTKEYRCDCGTLFSRRDSFITHRAFCDALAEETARAITGDPILPSQTASSSHMNLQFHPSQFNSHEFPATFSLKKEQQTGFNLRPEIPPWLMTCQPLVGTGGPGPGLPPPQPIDLSSSIFQSTRFDQDYTPNHGQDVNPNPSPNFNSTGGLGSPHISATALLQKAAQMGATMSNKSSTVSAAATGPSPTMLMRPHQFHVSAAAVESVSNNTTDVGLNLSSSEDLTTGFLNSLTSYGNKAATITVAAAAATATVSPLTSAPSPTSFLMTSFSSANTTGFEGSNFEDEFGGIGILNSKKGNDANDDMTKDFLGLRPLSHSDIFNIAGLVNTTSNENQSQNHKTWQS
ncbi:protein indeterminate-domain 7-like [Nicotiana tabacum]|uniref:Protein indeterminate-domain 7-like n=2 Tax=Nicotiana TaxID=4085 RepID=A0A1S3X0Y7_TOBAC|nr:PREDICTED: zinc finger protein NUTCRACKER-like [Nicotiana sylvestris]XP_009774629.1 PREDICTED: zinc finger protein NUTCRACKER-like [Nicotiana sylvestris]XP_016433584.1 PREDICTED: protein indeterminate-domain 7-like [Nicotiana tabacum]XP_016433590.1 PREDICTED: protein indeterminate-domain 7-like [Nicotiana tabacum]